MNLNSYINKPLRVLISDLNSYELGFYDISTEDELLKLKEVYDDVYIRRKIIKKIASNGNYSYTIYTK